MAQFWIREDDGCGDEPAPVTSKCPSCGRTVYAREADCGYQAICEDDYDGAPDSRSPRGWGPTERDAIEAFEDAASDRREALS